MSKIVLNGEVVELGSDGIPVQAFTQDQYEKLTEEEKQKSMLCLVDEPPFVPASVSIQEYDTTVDGCDWHVRKWSDGYVEMFGKQKLENVKIDSKMSSGDYVSSNDYVFHFPLILSRLYGMTFGLRSTGSASIYAPASTFEDELIASPLLKVISFRTSSVTISRVDLYAHIIGRWK